LNLVFDSSALVAYVENEPGGALVESLLADPHTAGYVHSINLCEVYYGARREHGEQAAQIALSGLRETGLSFREDMDEDLWVDAARLKADFKRVSLADCICAALARRVDGAVVTADREFEPLSVAGACRVRYIR
jgi:predicted nucleic acid-binding protein